MDKTRRWHKGFLCRNQPPPTCQFCFLSKSSSATANILPLISSSSKTTSKPHKPAYPLQMGSHTRTQYLAGGCNPHICLPTPVRSNHRQPLRSLYGRNRGRANSIYVEQACIFSYIPPFLQKERVMQCRSTTPTHSWTTGFSVVRQLSAPSGSPLLPLTFQAFCRSQHAGFHPSFSFGFYVPVHAVSDSLMTDLASSCWSKSRSWPSTILYAKLHNIFCAPLKPQSVPKARKPSSHFPLQHFPYDTTYTQSGSESC